MRLAAATAEGFTLEVTESARDAIVALRRLPSEVTLVDIGDGDAAGLARTAAGQPRRPSTRR